MTTVSPAGIRLRYAMSLFVFLLSNLHASDVLFCIPSGSFRNAEIIVLEMQFGQYCGPNWAKLENKTGEIAFQFRLFYIIVAINAEFYLSSRREK
ncbi:hypothetical protein [Prevotella sp. OH937_COT-195]|uniref:hypothetical protein n=1 Tax=Prevotella sp. OH937_COT-195 TaxID=2491051 RepID=UPI000F6509CC|nr:hypothetical protein [Prevotella sp. OH937_COT-195]RRC98425.1 hypothetical protein EII32_09285 [Prevotella sp. OH937_COT-195]